MSATKLTFQEFFGSVQDILVNRYGWKNCSIELVKIRRCYDKEIAIEECAKKFDKEWRA